MAESLISILRQLDDRIKVLTAQNAELNRRHAQISEENENLKRQAREALEARDKALLDAQYLAVSHKLADNPDTLITARRQISQMIRNIDRCLEMLKE